MSAVSGVFSPNFQNSGAQRVMCKLVQSSSLVPIQCVRSLTARFELKNGVHSSLRIRGTSKAPKKMTKQRWMVWVKISQMKASRSEVAHQQMARYSQGQRDGISKHQDQLYHIRPALIDAWAFRCVEAMPAIEQNSDLKWPRKYARILNENSCICLTQTYFLDI